MADILIDNEALPSTPATGKSVIFVDNTTKKLMQLDDGGTMRGVLSRNFSTASQGAGFATDTYVTNSGIQIPQGGIQQGMLFRWTITASKTGVGTAAAVYTFRLGAAQGTGDTSLVAITDPVAQTGVVDNGILTCTASVRTAGASGVIVAAFGYQKQTAAATGFGSGGQYAISGTVSLASAGGNYLGLSINYGGSANVTIASVEAELIG